MAILERIRGNAGLMVGVIGVALAAFVIGDGLQNGNTWFSVNQRVVLSVNDEDITIDEYDAKLQRLLEQVQQQSNGQLSDEQRVNVNNGLSQQLIADQLLRDLARQIGITVTGDEVYALLNSGQGVMPSPIAQQFFASLGIDINNTTAVNEFITQISDSKIQAMPQEQQGMFRNIQAQWQNVQKQVVTNRIQQKIGTLLSRTYKITALDQELAAGSGSRTVALVRTTPLAGSDKGDEPSEDEIKKYYNTHKSSYMLQSPTAEVSYIATRVMPSSEDYKAAEANAQKAYEELQGAEGSRVGDVVRNLGGTFNTAYITPAEVEQLGLGDTEVNFIKTAEIGTTHNSGLVGDKYHIIKLVSKKSAVEALGLKVIVLDSVSGTKADSLLTALKSGASFEDMVIKYSQDNQSKADSGRISQTGEYGIPMNTFTEAQLAGSPFSDVYTKPIGEPFIVSNGGAKFILKAVDAKPSVEKYQIAVVDVDATFSAKTYDAKYDELNRILGGGESFEEMSKKAEKAGLSATKFITVNTSTPQLGMIPSSRSLVQWALNADDEEITDKVHRLGTDYLAIAQVHKHYDTGGAPLALVREEIATVLSAEKRAKSFVSKVSAKGLKTLEEYATEFTSKVDTIIGVNYFVRGSEGATFNGHAMKTAIGHVSKPFVSGREVMVVQPTAIEPLNKSALEAQALQAEQGTGYQIVSRVFQNLLNRSKVQDNRARFY